MAGVPKGALHGETEAAKLGSEVWLLSGLISSLPGRLQLDDDRLTFTALGTGTCWLFQLRALERIANKAGFAHQVDSGEPGELFSVPLSQVADVLFPGTISAAA